MLPLTTAGIGVGQGELGNREPAESPPAFEIAAEEVRVLLVGSFGGCLEASALSLNARGLTITAGAERACVLNCPGGPEGAAALSVLHAQRCGAPMVLRVTAGPGP